MYCPHVLLTLFGSSSVSMSSLLSSSSPSTCANASSGLLPSGSFFRIVCCLYTKIVVLQEPQREWHRHEVFISPFTMSLTSSFLLLEYIFFDTKERNLTERHISSAILSTNARLLESKSKYPLSLKVPIFLILLVSLSSFMVTPTLTVHSKTELIPLALHILTTYLNVLKCFTSCSLSG